MRSLALAPAIVGIAALVGACATLAPGGTYPRQPSVAPTPAPDTPLVRQTASLASPHGAKSGFRLMFAGVDGLLTRLEMIDAARSTLDVQYYIYRFDRTGKLLTEAILRAADRGVRVRLLIDDGEPAPGDEQLLALDAHPNIEIRIFNPFAYRGHLRLIRAVEYAVRVGYVDYRMHNKLVVADNAIAIVGGRNVGDEYFQIDPTSHFGDDDIVAIGPVVRELSGSFDVYWNSSMAVPAPALTTQQRPPRPDPAREPPPPSPEAVLREVRKNIAAIGVGKDALRPGDAQRLRAAQPLAGMLDGRLPFTAARANLVYDSPDKRKMVRGEGWGVSSFEPLEQALDSVKSELLIVTPFFVPGPDGMKLIERLRERGVSVRVVTNSLRTTQETIVHSAYQRYRVPLLERGVHLYEVRSRWGQARGSGTSAGMARDGHFALHAKMFVLDRQRIFLGSLNFDRRSAELNTELGLLIDSPELAAQAARHFAECTRLDSSYALRIVPASPGSTPQLTWVTRERGQLVALDREPDRGPWQRLKVDLLSLLPLDEKL